ncbi:hypothetical protein RZS08_07940 [Arthrospira platensis SPKY1]|nr:hypothetical protein [Arthrospira platensis SPKY1]
MRLASPALQLARLHMYDTLHRAALAIAQGGPGASCDAKLHTAGAHAVQRLQAGQALSLAVTGEGRRAEHDDRRRGRKRCSTAHE